MRQRLIAAASLALAAWTINTMANGPGSLETSRWPVRQGDLEAAALTADPPQDMFATAPDMSQPRRIWHVLSDVPGGGDGTASHPFDSIPAAIEAAHAGDVVIVHRGIYRTPFTTKRDGRFDAPIRILSGGAQLVGNGQGRMVQILHSYITLEHFHISNADKLIWVQGATRVRLLDNVLTNAGGECIRIKYLSHDNEVAGNRISGCGARNFDLSKNRKNGEGIYLGTAAEQISKNPTSVPDESSRNYVHDNVISVPAECVDIKEGAERNLISRNLCVGSMDPEGGGFSSRGRATIFTANLSSRNAGAGIRLGGDAADDGIHSIVQNNRLVGNRGYGVKVMRQPQSRICGNTLEGNEQGNSNEATDPARAC